MAPSCHYISCNQVYDGPVRISVLGVAGGLGTTRLKGRKRHNRVIDPSAYCAKGQTTKRTLLRPAQKAKTAKRTQPVVLPSLASSPLRGGLSGGVQPTEPSMLSLQSAPCNQSRRLRPDSRCVSCVRSGAP